MTLKQNNPKDITYSKANVLAILKKRLKFSKIEDLYFFTVSEWNEDKKEILKKIKKNFKSKYIIVRSSALDEDTTESSKAGNYKSVLFVPLKSTAHTKKAIQDVIDSYSHKQNFNQNNQVLVQSQSEDIAISGVVFTQSEHGSPYYVINYDKGSLTDRVTKGEINNTIKIFRRKKIGPKNHPWNLLIRSIREIESSLSNKMLDIEFGLTKKNKVIIFQARPLIFVRDTSRLEKNVSKLIQSNIKKYEKKRHLKSNGISHTNFSDMSDWNPAEIIGDKPNLLDYSLYDYLVMKDSWRLGRRVIGYQDVHPLRLMVNFGGKPYVDIISSFSSMIPNNLPEKLKKKLLRFYQIKLKKNPNLHDKVEFEVLFTCYDFSIPNRLKELLEFGFNKNELNQIRNCLIDFTNNVIEKFPEIEVRCNTLCGKMIQNREQVISKLKSKPQDYSTLLDAANILLHDCRQYGVIPFSTMARISFIGSIILKSLLSQANITPTQYEQFLESVKTPVSDLRNDLQQYHEQKMSQKHLLKKYGHLRPGTYDILASRYDKNPDLMTSFKFIKPTSGKKFKEVDLSKIFLEHGLTFKSIKFFTFSRNAMSNREYLKFEFTRNLSDALELIAHAGRKLGFTRTEIANLDINTILLYKKLTRYQLQNLWKNKIKRQQSKKKTSDHMHLPPFISSKDEFEMFSYFVTQPNYITRKKVTADIANLKKSTFLKDISKKIVVIENADPGYDWIFTKNIAGLITKYGGVASHMAIRCSELGIPAAIGCGDLLYEKLKDGNKILLDCINKQIIILEAKKKDDFFEEKKVLKSLGYIK